MGIPAKKILKTRDMMALQLSTVRKSPTYA